MKSYLHRVVSALICLIVLTAQANADTPAEGLAVVASRGGDIQLTDSDGQSVSIKRFDQFVPAGQTLRTDRNSFVSVVLSNGVALYLGPQTEVTIGVLEHEYPPAGYSQRAFEPASSTITLSDLHGTIAISHPNRRAASTVKIIQDAWQLQLLSEAVVVQADSNDYDVAVIEGTAHVLDANGNRLDFIQSGQHFQSSILNPTRGDTQRLSAGSLREMQNLIELADAAADTVVFSYPEPGVNRPPRASIARDAAHFRKRAVDDYYLGGRNY